MRRTSRATSATITERHALAGATITERHAHLGATTGRPHVPIPPAGPIGRADPVKMPQATGIPDTWNSWLPVVELPPTRAEAGSYLSIELPPDSSAPGAARAWIRQRTEGMPREMVDDALLLSSELVTNAVQHGLPTITLTLRLHPPGLGIAVSDRGETLPGEQPTSPPEHHTSGRGLHIVDSLASDWGIDRTTETVGKTVWFELDPGTG